MAITKIGLKALKKFVLPAQKATSTNHKRALSLGYPDLLVREEDMEDLFGEEISLALDYRADSAQIAKWHNVDLGGIADSFSFFSALGFELDVVDITQARGREIILDMNHASPPDMHERYDLVIDGGTLEHCFNVAQAMENIATFVNHHGHILQSNPLSSFNHGFYNFNPTFYYDFYSKNGFEIEYFKGLVNPIVDTKEFDLPAHGRFQGVPNDASVILVAKRKTIVEIAWPIQSKYVSNPFLRG